MSVRNFLLILAIASVISFMMAQAVSIFAGQHVWYNLSSIGEDVGGQIPCEKCHADVADEISHLVAAHTGETGYGRFECEYCHRTFNLDNNAHGSPDQIPINETIYEKYYFTYARVSTSHDVQPGKQAHAASTIPCLYCHSGSGAGWYHSQTFQGKVCSCHGSGDGGDSYYYHGDRFFTGCTQGDSSCPVNASEEVQGECLKCHGTGPPIYIPPAGGFGLTANSSDTGVNASHYSFVIQAIENNTMVDANEACIACHTKIKLKINFNVTTEVKIECNNSYTKSSSQWDVKEISPSKYKIYEEVRE